MIHDNFLEFHVQDSQTLLRINGHVTQRPQHMTMRIAIAIHGSVIDRVIEISEWYFTHISPTLFNASTLKPPLSSYFLITMKDDSIESIYETLRNCVMISNTDGGIGSEHHPLHSGY